MVRVIVSLIDLRVILPVFPLACLTLCSHYLCEDLSGFVAESILTTKYDNQIYNLTGPRDYSFIQLNLYLIQQK